MSTDNNLKIRFRLPNGEEFEAEGSQAFIEQQRDYFLTLIGKGGNLSILPAITENTVPPTIAPAVHSPVIKSSQSDDLSPVRLWERILREEGNVVVFRKRHKLSPQEAVLLILAGARVLLQKQSCSALEVSRALKLSNLPLNTRLDRMLAGEIQQGYLTSEGSKRSRIYSLTESGAARAFVLAEKLSNI